MEFRNQIQGEKAVTIFQELQGQRVPLRFHVLGRGYERLSIVTGIEPRKEQVFVLLDLPAQFENEMPDAAGSRVQIEFVDRKGIPHSCRTVIHNVQGDDLWLVLPDYIERIQRRKHFRVEPPQGTRLVFPFQAQEVEAPVLNLSLGGVLGISPMKGDTRSLSLQAGMRVERLRLLSMMEEDKVEVGVNRAEVIRVEKIPDSTRINFAFQFLRMNRPDAQVLDRFLYYCQRRLLKKRSLLLGE